MLMSKNPDEEKIAELARLSKHDAAKWIKDMETGDIWVWPSDAAYHAEVASAVHVERYQKGIMIAEDFD